MLFPGQVAQLVIVRGVTGEIRITVGASNPAIEFRSEPTSENPDAQIFWTPNGSYLQISTAYIRQELASSNAFPPSWFVKTPSRGIAFDTDANLRWTDGNILSVDWEEWTNIVTFNNGWAGQVGFTPQNYRDPTGLIHLKGRLTPGVVAAGTVICTLSAMFRPTRTYFVPATQDNAPYTAPALEIASTGTVRIFGYTAGAMVLDNVRFHAFQ